MLTRALAAHAAGNIAEAERLYASALSTEPGNHRALHLLGMVEAQRGRHAEADRLLDRAAAANPGAAEIHAHHGIVLSALGRFEESHAAYSRALTLKPNDAEALANRADVSVRLGRYADALTDCDKAIALRPDVASTFNIRGNALMGQKRWTLALEAYDRALSIRPGHSEASINRGKALNDLKRYEEALTSCDEALKSNSDSAEAWNNRGNALLGLHRPEEALASYGTALSIGPDYAEAWNNRGNALQILRQPEEALASYDRALQAKPDYSEAVYNRGNTLHSLKRYEEASAAFARLLALDPGHEYARGCLFHSRLHCSDWRDFDDNARLIEDGIGHGKRTDMPFPFLAVSHSAQLQLRCARLFIADRYPPSPHPLWSGERYKHDKIRIAYLSADFHDHATAHLMAELFEQHDKGRFETTAISFGPNAADPMRARLERAFGRFLNVSANSDREVANILRELEVDIAVDLKGFTGDSRTGILALRPAPIQVNYLGYPGTMGAGYINYLMADAVVIPEGSYDDYAEKIVTLPGSYQVNDSRRAIAQRGQTRAEAGLPEEGFVFCSFNGNYKITPQLFDVWMRLLREVTGSVLWLLDGCDAAQRNLRREASARGISPDRIVFAPRMKLDEHLARHRLADLFLDTLPINAHTTASDALWAGLPIVTCLGTAFAGRVAASLLHAVGLPELVAQSLEEYEALALKLARDRVTLATLKARLEGARSRSPLFDGARSCRHIESAYTTMWKRYQRGESPSDFSVAPSD